MPPVDEAKEEEARLWQAVEFRGAVDRADDAKVQELMEAGANPIYKMSDGSSWTVLMLAANSGSELLVEKLSRGGKMPKVDDKDPHGYQAIMLAALQGHAQIVAKLIEKGADKDAINEDGETPLMMAAAHGHKEVVSFLLDSGADPNLLDKNDMSAIKKAARWGHLDCIRELLPKVEDNPRQLKHCMIFGKFYGHEDIVAEMKRILEPVDDGVEGEEDAGPPPEN
uniref:Peptidase A2 domain-containing protein n=1 Tax=Zooxanthella nutricula TaxID=1333877 RepID=A0A7S2PW22_9DINO